MSASPRQPAATPGVPPAAVSRWRWGVLLAVAVLTASRAPLLVSEPRLIAEEASVYLAYARDHGTLATLLLVPTSEGPAGYLHLLANLAALVEARWFPLESAAAVGTLIAFAFQLVPFAIVLWGRSVLFTTESRQLLGCLVLLFGPAMSPAVWLSTINAQVFCGVASLLILLENLSAASARRRWLYRALLLFNGLSGPYTALLTPGFLWRAFRLRSREARVQAGIVVATGVLQFAAYVFAGLGSELAPSRLANLGWGTAVSSILVFHVAGAVLGNELADVIGAPVGLSVQPDLSLATGSAPLPVLIIGAAGLVAWGAWLVRGRREWVLEALLISFVTMAASLTLVAHGLPWRRYSVVPGVAFLLVALFGGCEARRTLRRTACRTLLAVALVVGVATFWRDAPMAVSDFEVTNFGDVPGRPNWRHEVAAWRRDPSHRLRVWPFAGDRSWKAYLARPGDFQQVRLEPAGEWRLIALRETAERRVRIVDPPGDFRVHVAGHASAFPDDLGISLILIDGAPEPTVLARRRIRAVDEAGRFEAYLNPSYFEQGTNAGAKAERTVVLRVDRPAQDGVRIVFDRIAVVPRVEGLLDHWGFTAERDGTSRARRAPGRAG